MRILVTGAAGFIGYHLSERLLACGHAVTGIDNLNDYYDVSLKQARLRRLRQADGFAFERIDLADADALHAAAKQAEPDMIVHLAAQAGVRYSIEHPEAYVQSNLVGFMNVLEVGRRIRPAHLIYASSSSVYGANVKVPFSVDDRTDQPVSLYAATKKSNELLAYSYSHLYGIPMTGLRFFTVYGPWGRPDMAYYSFTKNIVEGRPIRVFNEGKMLRDFTYIDDVIDGIMGLIDRPPSTAKPPHRVYNLGNHQPVELMTFIRVLEQAIGRRAELLLEPMQPGDVPATYADIEASTRDFGFRPSISIETGLPRFVEWYRSFNG